MKKNIYETAKSILYDMIERSQCSTSGHIYIYIYILAGVPDDGLT